MSDPRQGYSADQIKAMRLAYMNTTLTVGQAAKKCGVGADKMRAILRAEGCKLRGHGFGLKQGRRGKRKSLAYVFGGMADAGLSTTGRTLKGSEFASRKAELEARDQSGRRAP